MYCAPCTVYLCATCNADPNHDEVHHRIGAARCDGCGHVAKVARVADHAHFPGGANLCLACRS
jgi:Pyruvate/2-oxoacid:ferredoxin oxidoreductase delta subunit